MAVAQAGNTFAEFRTAAASSPPDLPPVVRVATLRASRVPGPPVPGTMAEHPGPSAAAVESKPPARDGFRSGIDNLVVAHGSPSCRGEQRCGGDRGVVLNGGQGPRPRSRRGTWSGTLVSARTPERLHAAPTSDPTPTTELPARVDIRSWRNCKTVAFLRRCSAVLCDGGVGWYVPAAVHCDLRGDLISPRLSNGVGGGGRRRGRRPMPAPRPSHVRGSAW